MWGDPPGLEARGKGSERSPPRQNRGDGRLLTIPEGSDGQDSQGEAVCHRAVVPSTVKGGSAQVGTLWNFPFCK